MHDQVLDFVLSVKERFPCKFKDVSVVEVGSLNINGTVRALFSECNYVGVDLGAGKDVDVIGEFHTLNFSPPDVVISVETLEHDIHWRETLEHMHATVKAGGLMIVTWATPPSQRTTIGTSGRPTLRASCPAISSRSNSWWRRRRRI